MEKSIVHYELSNKLKVIYDKKNQPVYEMYNLEITYNTGEKQQIKLFSACDTIDIEKIDSKIKKKFFIDRLLGEEGLIKKQGRNDYIFVGKLERDEKGKYKAIRDYIMPNRKKTAQQQFDRYYPKIKEKLEKTNTKKQDSKNYVCSDLHGMYGSYIEVLKQLKTQDHLWILGDAADRGKYGIEIIKDIIKRNSENKDGPQVTYLLGNHDYLLIKVIEMMKKYNITDEELKDMINYKSYKEVKERSGQYQEEVQELALKITDMQVEKNIPLAVIDFIQRYSYNDGGTYTMWKYANLSKEEQNEIYDFLVNSPVFLSQQIGGKKLAFTHAVPLKLKKQLNLRISFKQMKDKFGEKMVLEFLQDRDGDEQFEQWRKAGYLTICGHIPVIKGIDDQAKTKGFIRIDAGCSMKGALALYCVEDEKTKFLPAREEQIGPIPDDNDEQER